MSTAATATTTYAGFLGALNSATTGVNMVPSSLNEEAIYEADPEAQAALPQLLGLDGERTDVAEVVRSALPVDMAEEEKGERAKSAEFTARVKYLEANFDRTVWQIFVGFTTRSPNTFDTEEDYTEYDRIIRFYGNEPIRHTMHVGEIPAYMGKDLMVTAKLNEPEDMAVASTIYFISGRLLATQLKNNSDKKELSAEAKGLAIEAFKRAAEIYTDRNRNMSAAISLELAAQIEEISGNDSRALRAAAAESWLASSRWAVEKENPADRASANIRIFRGLWNASKAGADETMISLLEMSAAQLIRAGRYESAANDYIRILKLKLGIESEEDAYEWDEVASDMATVMDYSRRAGMPSEYLDSLIELHGIATKNADETRVDA